ncbi:MAG TPA: AI-2E family transporter [Candidatus Saccharimonadales bacterium]|nr:AI-2E family transporter [Candidatus Saccharimonadales bacterium]
MAIRWKTVFIFIIAALSVWFLYAERTILSPFILAGIFAYLFNPIITFAAEKLKLPRTLSILIIYGILIGLFVIGALSVSSQVFEESSELRRYATQVLLHAKSQLSILPLWIRPTAFQLLTELEKSRLITYFNSSSLFPFVSQAISRIISFLIFLFSGFYFLQDGGKFFDRIIHLFPEEKQSEVEMIFGRINEVLGSYLRGEIFLIILMGVVTYIALSIIGVRFAVSIAIFSGFAEIVPVVGPIVAAIVAAIVALVAGQAHFGLSPVNTSLIVILIYFVLRHLEDYFVIPQVMGKITKLPPFIIFFAVVTGGHLAGILGLILAVPVAAILRILLEFGFTKVNGEKNE